MAVNESIYGAPETWVNCYYQQFDLPYKNKKAWFGGSVNQTQLRGGVAQNKLSYSTPIDKSIVYCGFGTESALSHISYIGKDPDNPNQVKILDTQDFSISNYALFEKTGQYGTQTTDSITYFRLDDIGRTAWNEQINTEWNIAPYLEPYTFVNPHNIALSIRVICGAQNLNSNVQNFTLKDYMSRYTQYPYVFSVYGSPCFGSAGNRSFNAGQGAAPSGWKYISVQLLDNMEIPSKNINEQCFFWTEPIYYMGYSQNRSPSAIIDNDIVYTFRTTEEGKSHIVINGGNVAIQYYDNLIEDILKTAACFGLYFTTDETRLTSMSNTDADMYIGILDSKGVGHGDYLRGAQTVNAPQADPNFTDMHSIKYNPETTDPTKYQNDTTFYAGYGTSSFTKFYALTEAQVNTLSQELYRIANDVPAGTSITEYNMKVFLTNNPIDCVISLKKFPVTNIPLATTDATIYLGSKATSITGKILVTPTWVYYFNFRNSSGTSCRAIFGDNFLDSEPYTKCKIVIPFCGTVDVPVSYIYQYDDLQVALVMDFITGACTAYILVNGITIDSITGACAIDLPVSGIQSATLDSQIHSVAMAREKQQTALGTGLIAGAVSIGIGLATGNLPVAIGGGAAIIGSFMHATDTGKQINYDLTHMDTPIKQVSAASGQIAHTYDMRCKMVITRPKIADEYSAEEYAQTIGFACLENGSVQDFHGFTVANIDLSGINCTAEEKELIRAAYASGVYLPAEYSENYWT